MEGGATPEELETLIEDALLLGDVDAATGLFHPSGVLVLKDAREFRGHRALCAALSTVRRHDVTYVATPRKVLQVRVAALLLGADTVNPAAAARTACGATSSSSS
ncbi:Cif family virulence factor [Streptacidiphilus rugosus]|uniref:hypothetical protein n=1 Tax=Streptacidiphilus rugosus TaxID=405783 RepID=UPI00056472CF|nr:hypothetical protein [Streptacidiphilus rugosus]